MWVHDSFIGEVLKKCIDSEEDKQFVPEPDSHMEDCTEIWYDQL